MAILIIALYVLGEVMADLDYYSKWYNTLPYWHKALGMITFALLLLRIGWVVANPKPLALPNYLRWEIISAKLAHVTFYIALVVISVSGYFITTAKGAPIDLFGWFEIPALTTLDTDTAKLAGDAHEISATVILVLFVLHVSATLKHHFVDKDVTFKRMLIPNEVKER